MIIGFEGQTTVVTGAAHGFGRAIALAFAERGAHVFACDVNADGLKETVRLGGGSCESVILDVSDRRAVQAAIAKIEAERGGIDILVNNAGGVCGQVGRPIEEISAADWQAIFDVNLSGTFFMTQAVATAMKRAKRGRVVNISSGAGRSISLTGIQAYASAKAGQIGLTRQLAHELGAWNITVNCIAPGFIATAMTEALNDDQKAKINATIPAGDMGTPEDIAASVVYLASDEAKYITGQTLHVNGGMAMI